MAMKCSHVDLGNGQHAIVCGSKRYMQQRCAGCFELTASKRCDWKRTDGKSPTCDAWICERCTTSVGPDKDLCPDHARAWNVHPMNPKNNPARRDAGSSAENHT